MREPARFKSGDWVIAWLVLTSTLSITLWTVLGGCEPQCSA
jgi:hypothetical protein